MEKKRNKIKVTDQVFAALWEKKKKKKKKKVDLIFQPQKSRLKVDIPTTNNLVKQNPS